MLNATGTSVNLPSNVRSPPCLPVEAGRALPLRWPLAHRLRRSRLWTHRGRVSRWRDRRSRTCVRHSVLSRRPISSRRSALVRSGVRRRTRPQVVPADSGLSRVARIRDRGTGRMSRHRGPVSPRNYRRKLWESPPWLRAVLLGLYRDWEQAIAENHPLSAIGAPWSDESSEAFDAYAVRHGCVGELDCSCQVYGHAFPPQRREVDLRRWVSDPEVRQFR